MKELRLELKTVPVRSNKADTFDYGKVEGEKFCHDIVIPDLNLRFTGVWLWGDEQKQKEQEQQILNRLRTAKVEVLKGDEKK